MVDVFVSYAHEDRDRVEPLVKRLEQQWSVWWDRELIPGDRFEQAIDAAITKAHVVVVAWSKAALQSTWVHNEALDGLERGILVPVLLDTVRVPVAFRQLQAARLQSWPDEFDARELDALYAAIRSVVAQARGDADSSDSLGEPSEATAGVAELKRLAAVGETDAAAALAATLALEHPDNAEVQALWFERSWEYELESNPPGARVFTKPYNKPEQEWQELGMTPLKARVGIGLRRFKVTLDGHDDSELADAVPGMLANPDQAELLGARIPRVVRMQPTDPNRGDMVFVSGGDIVLLVSAGGVPPKRQVCDYFIDRFPVTNAEFKEFVDAGGYNDAALWTDADLADVKERCLDATGRLAPAGWRFETFPEGEDDYPVTGVSWYEAMAFACFRGATLPTAAQWSRAAREYQEMHASLSAEMAAQSNFGDALQSVHESTGIGALGIRDSAGNAREWARNDMRDMKATLGGSYKDLPYQCIFNAPVPGWQRDDVTGFRTLIPLGDDEDLNRPISTFSKPRNLEPVGDEVFDILTTQFAYTRHAPIAQTTEQLSDEARLKIERIELRFPDSVLTLFTHQRRDRESFKPLVLFPGQQEFFGRRPSDPRETFHIMRMLAESGRQLVMPVYHGSNERYAGVWQMNAEEQKIYYRDAQPVWRREIGRTLDYLETLDNIDTDQAVFVGASYGVAMPLPAAIMEDRFRGYVLLHGGMVPWGKDLQAPIADMKNFVPRLTRPTFLMSGRFDSIFPLVSQEALYERIGTPEADKHWLQYDGGHGFITDKQTLELVNWLDERF